MDRNGLERRSGSSNASGPSDCCCCYCSCCCWPTVYNDDYNDVLTFVKDESINESQPNIFLLVSNSSCELGQKNGVVRFRESVRGACCQIDVWSDLVP